MCLLSFVLLPILSLVSAVFNFSASLNDVAPVSPTLFTVDMKRNEKSELLMDVFWWVFFLLFLRSRLSSVSVVFDFNDSPSVAAARTPISLPVYLV